MKIIRQDIMLFEEDYNRFTEQFVNDNGFSSAVRDACSEYMERMEEDTKYLVAMEFVKLKDYFRDSDKNIVRKAISMNEDFAKEVDKHAKTLGMSRSDFMRRIIKAKVFNINDYTEYMKAAMLYSKEM